MPPDADVSARDALLAAFLADPPPRRVPPELKRAAGRQGPSWFFGGFGLLFGGFGLFFAWMFFPWNIYRGWQLADAPTAPGRITAVSATGLRENKQRVYRYDFDFSPPAGGRVEGTCYTTGQRWNAGAPVTVRYKPDDPAWCCIEGARTSVGSALSALVLLFPAIGGSLVAWVVMARRRLSFLLEHGQVGQRYFIVDDKSVPSTQMVHTAARALGVPGRILPLPKFFCLLAMGPIITESMTCDFRFSNQKLKSLGFALDYPDIDTGIPDVVRRWRASRAAGVVRGS